MNTDPVLVELHADRLTVEPPPGFSYPQAALALVSFPDGQRTVVLTADSVDQLRDLADSILGMCDDLACTCVDGIRPDCPTHGGD